MAVHKLENRYVDADTFEVLTGEFEIPGGKAHLVAGIIHRNPKEGPAMIDAMGAQHYVVNGVTDRIVYPWQTEFVKQKIKIVIDDSK